MEFDHACANQCAWIVFGRKTIFKIVGDLIRLILGKRSGIKCGCVHHEHFDWIGITRTMSYVGLVVPPAVLSHVRGFA